MIIKRMRASFGKLHDTLELHEGMNLLTLPNEAGKSTWSAFLVSMLYGVDTSERANLTNQGLPIKERYRPWDGSAMEGAVDLVWNGREITIERTTSRRIPMGEFRAYETQSGIPVTELTGENCGRMLCGEHFVEGDLIRVYVVEVRRSNRGPQVLVSRTHPALVKRLFELEVPEIESGAVEIRSIAREPGSRTKLAVYAAEENIDPVGACVGARGARVGAVVDELQGEKMDIVVWSEDICEFVASALSPADVISVVQLPGVKACRVIVPDDQLSLAIGKEGQNARLAARLTGCKIDIKPASQADAFEDTEE